MQMKNRSYGEATSLKQSDSSQKFGGADTLATDQIESAVIDVLATTQCIDMHTHIYPPAFEKLGSWGIDELLTYH
jgi:hypothetical protein